MPTNRPHMALLNQNTGEFGAVLSQEHVGQGPSISPDGRYYVNQLWGGRVIWQDSETGETKDIALQDVTAFGGYASILSVAALSNGNIAVFKRGQAMSGGVYTDMIEVLVFDKNGVKVEGASYLGSLPDGTALSNFNLSRFAVSGDKYVLYGFDAGTSQIRVVTLKTSLTQNASDMTKRTIMLPAGAGYVEFFHPDSFLATYSGGSSLVVNAFTGDMSSLGTDLIRFDPSQQSFARKLVGTDGSLADLIIAPRQTTAGRVWHDPSLLLNVGDKVYLRDLRNLLKQGAEPISSDKFTIWGWAMKEDGSLVINYSEFTNAYNKTKTIIMSFDELLESLNIPESGLRPYYGPSIHGQDPEEPEESPNPPPVQQPRGTISGLQIEAFVGQINFTVNVQPEAGYQWPGNGVPPNSPEVIVEVMRPGNAWATVAGTRWAPQAGVLTVPVNDAIDFLAGTQWNYRIRLQYAGAEIATRLEGHVTISGEQGGGEQEAPENNGPRGNARVIMIGPSVGLQNPDPIYTHTATPWAWNGGTRYLQNNNLFLFGRSNPYFYGSSNPNTESALAVIMKPTHDSAAGADIEYTLFDGQSNWWVGDADADDPNRNDNRYEIPSGNVSPNGRYAAFRVQTYTGKSTVFVYDSVTGKMSASELPVSAEDAASGVVTSYVYGAIAVDNSGNFYVIQNSQSMNWWGGSGSGSGYVVQRYNFTGHAVGAPVSIPSELNKLAMFDKDTLIAYSGEGAAKFQQIDKINTAEGLGIALHGGVYSTPLSNEPYSGGYTELIPGDTRAVRFHPAGRQIIDALTGNVLEDILAAQAYPMHSSTPTHTDSDELRNLQLTIWHKETGAGQPGSPYRNINDLILYNAGSDNVLGTYDMNALLKDVLGIPASSDPGRIYIWSFSVQKGRVAFSGDIAGAGFMPFYIDMDLVEFYRRIGAQVPAPVIPVYDPGHDPDGDVNSDPDDPNDPDPDEPPYVQPRGNMSNLQVQPYIGQVNFTLNVQPDTGYEWPGNGVPPNSPEVIVEVMKPGNEWATVAGTQWAPQAGILTVPVNSMVDFVAGSQWRYRIRLQFAGAEIATRLEGGFTIPLNTVPPPPDDPVDPPAPPVEPPSLQPQGIISNLSIEAYIGQINFTVNVQPAEGYQWPGNGVPPNAPTVVVEVMQPGNNYATVAGMDWVPQAGWVTVPVNGGFHFVPGSQWNYRIRLSYAGGLMTNYLEGGTITIPNIQPPPPAEPPVEPPQEPGTGEMRPVTLTEPGAVITESNVVYKVNAEVSVKVSGMGRPIVLKLKGGRHFPSAEAEFESSLEVNADGTIKFPKVLAFAGRNDYEIQAFDKLTGQPVSQVLVGSFNSDGVRIRKPVETAFNEIRNMTESSIDIVVDVAKLDTDETGIINGRIVDLETGQQVWSGSITASPSQAMAVLHAGSGLVGGRTYQFFVQGAKQSVIGSESKEFTRIFRMSAEARVAPQDFSSYQGGMFSLNENVIFRNSFGQPWPNDPAGPHYGAYLEYGRRNDIEDPLVRPMYANLVDGKGNTILKLVEVPDNNIAHNITAAVSKNSRYAVVLVGAVRYGGTLEGDVNTIYLYDFEKREMKKISMPGFNVNSPDGTYHEPLEVAVGDDGSVYLLGRRKQGGWEDGAINKFFIRSYDKNGQPISEQKFDMPNAEQGYYVPSAGINLGKDPSGADTIYFFIESSHNEVTTGKFKVTSGALSAPVMNAPLALPVTHLQHLQYSQGLEGRLAITGGNMQHQRAYWLVDMDTNAIVGTGPTGSLYDAPIPQNTTAYDAIDGKQYVFTSKEIYPATGQPWFEVISPAGQNLGSGSLRPLLDKLGLSDDYRNDLWGFAINENTVTFSIGQFRPEISSFYSYEVSISREYFLNQLALILAMPDKGISGNTNGASEGGTSGTTGGEILPPLPFDSALAGKTGRGTTSTVDAALTTGSAEQVTSQVMPVVVAAPITESAVKPRVIETPKPVSVLPKTIISTPVKTEETAVVSTLAAVKSEEAITSVTEPVKNPIDLIMAQWEESTRDVPLTEGFIRFWQDMFTNGFDPMGSQQQIDQPILTQVGMDAAIAPVAQQQNIVLQQQRDAEEKDEQTVAGNSDGDSMTTLRDLRKKILDQQDASLV